MADNECPVWKEGWQCVNTRKAKNVIGDAGTGIPVQEGERRAMAEVKEELKPCPFCGGKASINYERISGEHKGFWAQVICNSCHGRSGGTWAGSYNAAERIETKAWNRRTNDETD